MFKKSYGMQDGILRSYDVGRFELAPVSMNDYFDWQSWFEHGAL
jgi:hypothetical protein